MNAILNCSNLSELEGTTLYVTMPPCAECAKAIIQVGIKEVRLCRKLCSSMKLDRWKESMEITESMFEESGVEFLWV